MIFLHQWEQISSPLVDTAKVWTFDGPVVGVMSDQNGVLEGASTPILGWPGTFYPAPFTARGIEPLDSYVVSGNSITVNMHVGQPGDYIRVVTVPGGTTAAPRTTWGRLRRVYR